MDLQVDTRDQALVGMGGQAAARWGRAMCSRRGGRTTSSIRLSPWPGVPTGVLDWGPAPRCCSSLLQGGGQRGDTVELLSADDGPWAADVTVHGPAGSLSRWTGVSLAAADCSYVWKHTTASSSR